MLILNFKKIKKREVECNYFTNITKNKINPFAINRGASSTWIKISIGPNPKSGPVLTKTVSFALMCAMVPLNTGTFGYQILPIISICQITLTCSKEGLILTDNSKI